MGALSNHLLVAAILSYVLAMLAYAVEFAFGERTVVARVAARQLVGAGAPAPSAVEEIEEPPSVFPSAFPRRMGLAGYVLTILAVVAHVATLVTRGFAAGRVPWGNMYEFIIAVTLVGSVAWLLVATAWPRLRHLGLFTSLVISLLLAVAGMVLYTPAGPLVPALDSYWLKIHVTAASLASGILLVGFVAAALHLMKLGCDKGLRRFPS